MRLHETRTVDRELDYVFAFTSDFANADIWDPGVESSEQVGEGPARVGTEYRLVVRFGSRRIPMTYVITAMEKNTRGVLLGKGPTVTAIDVISFESSGNTTIIDYTADLTFDNWIRFVEPLVAPFLRRFVGRKALDGLVTALER
jgi:hypothetical protein